MMITNDQMQIFINCFALASLALAWHLFWRPFATCRFRQDLFDLRDSLFDKVDSGETTLKFDSTAYCDLRNDINTMIRFANHLGFAKLLFTSLFVRSGKNEAKDQAAEARMKLSDQEKELVRDIDQKQSRIIMRYFLHSSFLMWFLLLCVISIAICLAFVEYTRSRVITLRATVKKILVEPTVNEAEYQSGQLILFGNC